MSEPFSLDDLTPQEIQFDFRGKRYVLKEAPEGVVAAWKSAAMKYAIRDAQGNYVGASGGAELDAVLVAGCLFEKTPSGETPVSVEAVRAWGSRAVQRLHKKTQEMSGLRDEAETPESLQKQFESLAEKLASQASSPAEKRQWVDWMVKAVHEKAAPAGLNGSHEEREKNSPAATPATSA